MIKRVIRRMTKKMVKTKDKKKDEKKKKEKLPDSISADKIDKNSYMSQDAITGEVHIDKYNIDFLRYFKLNNFILALAGSIIGFVCTLAFPDFFGLVFKTDMSVLYTLFVLVGIGWLIITAFIAYKGIDNMKQALRIAGRRGLFAFTVMMLAAIILLSVTGKIYWSQKFYYFIKLVIITMFFEGVFAVPLDYGLTFLHGMKKKKMLDSI